MKRLLASLLSLLAAVALATGCGSSKDHNAQDVSFAKDMIPHHEQAIVMSDVAVAQAANPQVRDLATRIKAAQGPEITTMTGWLSSWGEEPVGDMGGMDMSTMPGMEGMLSDGELQALRDASGPQFDRLFLQGMTEHHQGAVAMARVEIEKGRFRPAKDLAVRIMSDQEKEIAEMAQLLRTVGA